MLARMPLDSELLLLTGRYKRTTLSRAEIIATFQDAFQMIGGIPRLAIWADTHPTEFYKMHARLLPASSTAELDGSQEIIIQHAIPTHQLTHNATNNNTSLHPARDLYSVPPEDTAVGNGGSPPQGWEDSGDDK